LKHRLRESVHQRFAVTLHRILMIDWIEVGTITCVTVPLSGPNKGLGVGDSGCNVEIDFSTSQSNLPQILYIPTKRLRLLL
jgi:hypothetical protein